MRFSTAAAAAGILCAVSFAGVQAFQARQTGPRTARQSWPPPVSKTPEKAPPLSAEDELKTIVLPPGYHAQLVANEPLVVDPIAIEFDADGRLWVLEMPGFMSEPGAMNSREPVNDLAVLEDTNGDGVMDKRTVFADKLVLPRSFKVLAAGVLIGEPPNLWLMKDTDGDLKADTKELVNNTYGRGEASIEHNANSLFWALDNTIYTSEHDWHLRLKNGKFETIPTLSRGQWGIAQDDAGRIYRNVNDAPLFVDYVAARYYTRNPNLARTRGLYDPLIEREDSIIWPIRQTRGVNRGYRDQLFRSDDSSVTIQGCGTPIIYRGDRLPKDLQGDAFITDSTTNLVHRYKIVDDGTGRLKAVDAYKKGEIMASTDERFRPVNLSATAPDGTMYVVDMYRGVVQEAVYWTDYLRDYIKARDLEQPMKHGRIWRILHDTTRRDKTPALSKATFAELLQALSHPNGWWRDTAQQLLVQRGDQSITPQLKELAAHAPDWRTRLHALWTLDGLEAIEPALVEQALADKSSDVRASALRLSERWLGEPNSALTNAVLRLMDDPTWTVRRQLAATIGELPPASRLDPAVTTLTRYGSDPVTVDATISGLRGREGEVLARVVQARASAGDADAVTMLAAAIARSGDAAAVQQIILRIADGAAALGQRMALLQGLDTGLPAAGGGRAGGRGGRGGRAAVQPARPVSLPAEPVDLVKLAAGAGELATIAKRVVAKLEWSGKPVPVAVEAVPLTPEQQHRFDEGADLYKSICIGCHQADGRGKDKIAPSLVDSRYVTGFDAGVPTRILLAGKEGAIGLMPPLGGSLTDDQIASVLTYVRREWGHTAPPVEPEDVREIRGLTKARTRPWTDPELQGGRGGRGGPGRGGS
ncbi:MAG: c-type cytochrome [Acidobacteriota bacterium]|nr:c-type cytochrome [Acidobacteriota bacterium]